jgi:hypothetical protein
MSVKWKVGRAGRQFGEFDIEWVSATCNASVARCAEGSVIHGFLVQGFVSLPGKRR